MSTIAEVTAEGAWRLAEASVDEPRRTAGLLLQHALGVDRAYLIARSDETISAHNYAYYLTLIERRASGEPMQYITGRQEFFGLEFKVTPSVLIPRPETEHLVEQVLRLLQKEAASQGAGGKARLIADVGTGSGCIAVALAVNAPDSRLIAIDVSGAALEIAKQNAEAHGVGGRIGFLQGDLLLPLDGSEHPGRVDIIASNPPYVPTADIDHLQREIREHEPAVALLGGDDGLTFYRRLLDEAPVYLKRGGHLVCEIGFNQLAAIQRLVDSSAWDLVEVATDLQGIPRTVTLQKK